MSSQRARNLLPLAGEFLAALAMLAILILSFAPVTPANSVLSSATAPELSTVSASWCGGPVQGDADHHVTACHACRVDAVELPPAPCAAEPAFTAVRPAPLAELRLVVPGDPTGPPSGPRAPPFVV